MILALFSPPHLQWKFSSESETKREPSRNAPNQSHILIYLKCLPYPSKILPFEVFNKYTLKCLNNYSYGNSGQTDIGRGLPFPSPSPCRSSAGDILHCDGIFITINKTIHVPILVMGHVLFRFFSAFNRYQSGLHPECHIAFPILSP